MTERRTVERRKHVRFPVHFQSVLCIQSAPIKGEGIVLDISLGGCRIASEVALGSERDLELRIHLPDQDSPLVIERAVVRWARDEQFGAEFLQLPQGTRTRLRHAIENLEAEAVEERAGASEPTLPAKDVDPDEQ